MVRRVSRFLAIFPLAFPILSPAAAGERLVMPYDCRVEADQLRLSPSPERSYAIVGEREEQTVSTCPAAMAESCRTVMVHRFAIACGNASADWMQVAGAIRGAAANRAWIEGSRLNLVMPARSEGERANCRMGPSSAPGTSGGRDASCQPWRRGGNFDHLILPAGFAPIGELGARLMIGIGDEVAAAPGAAAARLYRSATDGEVTVAKADPLAVLEPSARRDTFETALEPGPDDDWITVVRAGDDAPVPTAYAAATPLWALLSAAGAMLALLILFGVRYLSLREGFAIRGAAAGTVSVAAMLQQTEQAAKALKAAGPLREVLLAELRQVRVRLAGVERSSVAGEMPAERLAPTLRGMVRELERIRRIIDSAAVSLTDARRDGRLPRTMSEAYEVLGVNAEVSAGVAKKIVDALRMSWHPDHARDDADRALREDRIRQINIAWDLINAKREAA